MNTWRTLGPDIVANDYSSLWVYIAGPLIGAGLAVVMSIILRGAGGGRVGSLAAQGIYAPEIRDPDKR